MLDATRAEIYERLDREFYEPRLATLTPAEQDLLLASAHCPYPPLRAADLRAASKKTSGNINVVLGRLVEAGALYRLRAGQYAYTAPRFRDYLQLIFVDTSFWLGLTNRRDTKREQAKALLTAHDKDRLVTTNEVRGETWTFLRPRAGHAVAGRQFPRRRRSLAARGGLASLRGRRGGRRALAAQ